MLFVYVCSTWCIDEIVTRFEMWITRNDVKDVSLFHVSYLIRFMDYLFSQWPRNLQVKYFMFNWPVYRLLVLNKSWKRDSFQIMIFVYICSTWNLVELKPRFETRITVNDVNGVSLFHLSYIITLMAYLCSQWTTNYLVFYLWLVDLQTICAKYWLETWLSLNNDIRICLLDMKHIWT
jgi:hypothetical protein